MIFHKKETGKNWVSDQTCFIKNEDPEPIEDVFNKALSLYSYEPCLWRLPLGRAFQGTANLKQETEEIYTTILRQVYSQRPEDAPKVPEMLMEKLHYLLE